MIHSLTELNIVLMNGGGVNMTANEYGLVALFCVIASIIFMAIDFTVLQDLFELFSIVAIIVGWWNGKE